MFMVTANRQEFRHKSGGVSVWLPCLLSTLWLTSCHLTVFYAFGTQCSDSACYLQYVLSLLWLLSPSLPSANLHITCDNNTCCFFYFSVNARTFSFLFHFIPILTSFSLLFNSSHHDAHFVSFDAFIQLLLHFFHATSATPFSTLDDRTYDYSIT